MVLKKYLLLAVLALPFESLYAQTCKTSTIPESTPTDRFTIMSKGNIVQDNLTGLIWKRCSEGQAWDSSSCGSSDDIETMNWQAALNYVEVYNNDGGFEGNTDWRLPNLKELSSIAERQCELPAINSTVFPGTASIAYWSASPSFLFSNEAWMLNFSNGLENGANKSGSHAVRLVRSGQ